MNYLKKKLLKSTREKQNQKTNNILLILTLYCISQLEPQNFKDTYRDTPVNVLKNEKAIRMLHVIIYFIFN